MRTLDTSEASIEGFQKTCTSLSEVRKFLLEVYSELTPEVSLENIENPPYSSAIKVGGTQVSIKKDIFDSVYRGGNTLSDTLYSGINDFFKSGLKDLKKSFQKNEHGINITLKDLSNETLADIRDGKIADALAFTVEIYLQPRYLKDGDAGTYSFVFEIKRKSTENGSEFSTVCIKKSTPNTTQKDASIERAREAYKSALLRVVRSGSFSGK